MAVKYLAGNRFIGTAGERLTSTTHQAGDVNSKDDNQFVQSSNWAGNIYDHADYSGIIIKQVTAWIRWLDGSEAITCSAFAVSSNGQPDLSTQLFTADATVTGSGNPQERTWSFANNTTATPAHGNNGFFLAFNSPNSDDYSPNAVYRTEGYTASAITHLHGAKKYSGSWTDETTNQYIIHLTYNANALPNIPSGSIFEESDTGKHYMFDGTDTWNEVA